MSKNVVVLNDITIDEVNEFVDILHGVIVEFDALAGQEGYAEAVLVIEKFRDAFVRDVLIGEGE